MVLDFQTELESLPRPAPARLGVIWAQGSCDGRPGAIGYQGQMPWHVPEDLRWFQRVTSGMPVIMGRRTWESLPEKFRPLPNRTNLIVSRQLADPPHPDARVCGSLAEALAAVGDTPVWVIGGGQLYREAVTHADTAVITDFQLEVANADTFAPQLPESAWQKTWQSKQYKSRTGVPLSFSSWQRR